MISGKIMRICVLALIMMVMGKGRAWADTWDGTIPSATKLADAGFTQAGTSADPYIIDTAEKFVAFGLLVNNNTAYWKLTADIDLGSYEWPYSGNNTKTFKGHFDGGGHTISNYKITPVTNKANGLFGTVQGSSATNRAEIKNLKLDDVTISTTADLGSTAHIGALVGNSNQYVDFKNIQIEDVNSNGKTVNITFDNLIGNCNIGGLIGQLNKDSRMEDCTVNKPVILIKGEGAVKGTVYIGGAIGLMQGASATDVSKIDKPTSGSTNGLTVNNPSVTVHKILSSWYIASAIGKINNYSDVNYVTVKDPTLVYKAVGSPNVGLYLGTLTAHIVGNVGSATATPVATPVKNITISGTSNITIGTGIEEIKYIKAGVVGYIQSNVDIDTWNIGTSNITADGSLTTSTNYFGGVIGHVQSNSSAASTDTQTQINNVTLGSSTISVTGNVVKESHIGNLFGRIEGNAGSATVKPKRTVVSNLTTTGLTKIVFGSDSKKVDVANVRAGAIGSAAVNSDISDCTLKDTEIEVNGNLITGSSYIGGIVGQVQSSTSAFPGVAEGAVATKIHGVTVKKSDVNVTGNVGVLSYIGGGFGQVSGATSTTVAPQATEIKDIDIKNNDNGISKVTIGTDNTNTINYVKTGGVIGMANTNVILDDWDIEKINVQINGKLLTGSSYIGGCIGQMQSVNNAPVKATNIQVTTSSAIAINGDVEKEVYVGGAFGRMDATNQTQNQAATAENVNVNGLDMTFGGDFKQHVYAGGIVGYLYSMNTTSCPNPTSVINCSAKGQIHSNGSKTIKEGLYYAFGGIVGYNNQSNTTNQSIIRQCLSEVDINLGGYVPATATNLTKMFFIVGGVIGRLDNPSLLPEHLYYSGKIYAPYATVGPIVGTFYKNAGAQYVYEDYSGEYAAPTLSAQEWEKANTWYYHDYKLGLSADVRTQTARTRNYRDADVSDGYLTVTDQAFSAPNSLNGGKVSQTVLRYTANNKNQDFGIYPQWSTASSAYPTYYMYYMQGVNRGVYMENAEFAKLLIDKQVSVSASMQTEQATGSYTFTANIGEIADEDGFTITYQWYKSDETTAIDGATSKSITLTEDELTSYDGTVYCKITVSGTGFSNVEYILKGSNAYVVFIDGTNGVDNTSGSTARGWTPETPVRTIDHANSLLRSASNGGTCDNNIIVVMGILNSDYIFQSTGTNPATLTGKWDGKDYNGVIRLKQVDPTGGEHVVNPVSQPGRKGANCYVLGDTKFENLTFYSNKGNNVFIELHGRDVTFGKGLVMQNFAKLSANHGNFGEQESIPEFTVILTATNLSDADVRTYFNAERTKPQEVTFLSGHYGRILAGRFTQGFFNTAGNTANSILCSAKSPLWAKVNIEIDKENEVTDGAGTVYTCDINGLIAGLTDGTMYGDFEINFRGGSVAYIVGGNQGNPVNNGTLKYTPLGGKEGAWGQWPNASYFGRTVINVEQKHGAKDIVIGNLFAGGLGRKFQSTGQIGTAAVDMYMYGRTEVNVKSGTISGNVYGGGVGGVIGINPWDAHLPYATSATNDADHAIQNGVQYGDSRYGTWSSMEQGQSPLATVTLHNWNATNYVTEDCDLASSSTTVNISGGEVKGSVYGGGYGYVDDMPQYAAMQGIGSVFGTSNINVTGGTIGGNVYGGSEGSSFYFGEPNRYGQPVTNIAEMNGTVNMNISGNPTIKGNIFGAGQGIASTSSNEYVNIARTGNSELGYASTVNITVDLPHDHAFTGNIYGGGELGLVDGNSQIIVHGGDINGNVFGGGKGENGHPNKARMTGSTTVTIDMNDAEDHIRGDVYGGGELAAVTGNATVLVDGTGAIDGAVYGGGSLANLNGNTMVQLFGGSVGSAYGGGLGAKAGVNGALADVAAIVGGTATVQLGKDDGTAASKVTGEGIFGCNNLNGTPKGHVLVHVLKTMTRGQENRNVAGSVDNFDVAAVYGGGNKAAYQPTSEDEYPEVVIENCDNSIAYVYGGGNAAPVPATDVTIYGADAIDNAFAGGNGEGAGNLGADIGYLDYTRDDVHKYGSGKALIKVYGGTVHNVYGGSNTLGYIRTGTKVETGDKPEGDPHVTCTKNIGNTFGGGNKADITSDIVIDCHCGQGGQVLYGGANRANVLGNVTINIYSGAYEQVFCGNNQSGVIKGKLTINVDETECDPIMIGELYGCGNNAPYSVYGYNTDNTPRESLAELTPAQIAEEHLPYPDPEINIISCTRINRVFGGGYSSKATVYGNTHVNINLIEGIHNGTTVTPKFILDPDDHYAWKDNTTTLKSINIPAGVGYIGNVYGGGNEASVVGNTYVNIFTQQKNRHLYNASWVDDPDDNRYSDQDTSVNIEGDVFGGSKGSATDPEAGKVTGTTNVLIGYE